MSISNDESPCLISEMKDHQIIEVYRVKLTEKLSQLQSHVGGKATIAACLSVLHKNPCLLRCDHELRQSSLEKSMIDPLYSAKHDYAKAKIIDAILQNFSSTASIKGEYDVGFGRLDVAVLLDTKKSATKKPRIIGIEIKSGKSIDLFQIERYLYQCDILVIVRIGHQDVSVIRGYQVSHELDFYMHSIMKKADSLIARNLKTIEGQWCRGCPVQCEFRKHGFTNTKLPSLDEIPEFLRSVPIATKKTITILEREIMMFQTSDNNREIKSDIQNEMLSTEEPKPP